MFLPVLEGLVRRLALPAGHLASLVGLSLGTSPVVAPSSQAAERAKPLWQIMRVIMSDVVSPPHPEEVEVGLHDLEVAIITPPAELPADLGKVLGALLRDVPMRFAAMVAPLLAQESPGRRLQTLVALRAVPRASLSGVHQGRLAALSELL